MKGTNELGKESFGERLRRLREAKGMTQTGLGMKLHTSQNMMHRYETDKTYPGALILESMADVLGVSMDYLWKGK